MGNASTGTKGKSKYASSGTLHASAPVAQQGVDFREVASTAPAPLPTPFVSPLRRASLLSFKSLVEDLRQIRDERHYAPGHHCFRAWVMHTYGEKLGGWLDDIL